MTARRTAVAASLFCILSFFGATAAHGDSIISLASLGTSADSGESNSMGATIAISPNTSWATALTGSSWVSFANTGNTSAPGFVTVANGTVVSFFDTFNIAGTPTGGTITVMADDSATVLLNGVNLMSEVLSTGNTYTTCSNFGIGCVTPTTITIPASDLQTGSNTLEFNVAQRAGYSFGLDYIASITDPSSMTEPASGSLLVLGLVGLGAMSIRRKGWQV
jgi:hypothetical protein